MSDAGTRGPFTTIIFNPALLSKEDLIRGFVARQDLLNRLLDDLRRVQRGSPPQHQLVIGQRGLGKTTLLRRLAFAVEDDPELVASWLPLVFPEEQYNVSRLGDLWLNCADALSDALDRMGHKAAADALDRKVESVPSDTGRRSAAALLVLVNEAERIGRGLVLLVDNLDLVLDRLNRDEEWEFRRVISDEHRLYFIGASSRALEAVYEHGRAFFDYFQVHELKGLSDAEMFAVLGRLAKEEGNERVSRLIEEKPARVRALRVLTGGNPRTLVLLYRVLAEGPEGDVGRDIEQLLDLYTPLYKARFEDLPPQSQQVVDAMGIHWDPITAAELAQKLAPLSVNLVSAQLKRLEDLGVVEKAPWFDEKKTAFQISERFFNIWYLMRASRRVRRRLIWLAKFLESWFERDELGERARRYLERDPVAVGRERYVEMTLAYSQLVDDRHLRRGLETAGLRTALDCSLGGQFDFSDLPPEVQDQKARMERLRDLRARVLGMRLEEVDAANLWRLLGGSPHLSLEEKARVVDELPGLGAGAVIELYGDLEHAEQGLNAVFPDGAAAISRLYEALANGEMTDAYDVEGALAVAGQTGFQRLPEIAIWSRSDPTVMPAGFVAEEVEKAEAAWRTLAAEAGYDAVGWNGLGSLFRCLKRYEEAEQAYRKAIETDPTSSAPWKKLANLLHFDLQRYDNAEQAYRRATELDPNDASVWRGLGHLLYYSLERSAEAEAPYRYAVDLDPENAESWAYLARLLHDGLRRHEESETAYRRAIEIEPVLVLAWSGLGDLLREIGRYQEAEDACRRAVGLDPEDAYLWVRLGLVLETRKMHEEAEQAFRRAIDANPRYDFAWSRLGSLLRSRGSLREAEEAYRRAIELDPRDAYNWDRLGNLLEHDPNRRQDAESAYRQAVEVDPQYSYAWGSLADLIGTDGSRKGEAMAAAVRAIELDPTAAWPRSVALQIAKSSEPAAALQAVARIHEVAPEDREMSFLLAGLLALNGEWDRAKQLLLELLAAEDEQADTWAFGAIVKAGHVDDAIALLEETGANERWRPLYEALRAIRAGSRLYLRRVAPEVRGVAEQILDEIAPKLPKGPRAGSKPKKTTSR